MEFAGSAEQARHLDDHERDLAGRQVQEELAHRSELVPVDACDVHPLNLAALDQGLGHVSAPSRQRCWPRD
jgi:hypothetical protein